MRDEMFFSWFDLKKGPPEPAPRPVKDPPDPLENPDIPVREPDPNDPPLDM